LAADGSGRRRSSPNETLAHDGFDIGCRVTGGAAAY